MPSHLTRRVFRRLLANEPIVHRGCLRRRTYASSGHIPRITLSSNVRHATRSLPSVQTRSFINFNMFRKRKETREVDMDPGLEKMMELDKMQRMGARPPPVADVADAFKQFFDAKCSRQKDTEDTQADLALQSLKYCLKEVGERHDEALIGPFAPSTLAKAAIAGGKGHTRISRLTQSHVAFCKAVHDAMLLPWQEDRVHRTHYESALKAYIGVLCSTGSTSLARETLLELEKWASSADAPSSRAYSYHGDVGPELELSEGGAGTEGKPGRKPTTRTVPDLRFCWSTVLNGFAKERDDANVVAVLSMMDSRGYGRSIGQIKTMIRYSMDRNDAGSVKAWWKESEKDSKLSMIARSSVLEQVLGWCLARGELEFGHDIVREVMSGHPSKRAWDAVLVWGAGTRKSVDEVDRMMMVMESANTAAQDRGQWRAPDIDTMNGLIEFAVNADDPYMAERFIALGASRAIHPNERTYLLQMEYRLRVGDIDGALVAYKGLQSHDLSGEEDVPAVNRLIVALCKTQRHDFDTIMNVAADLSDRRVRFDPLTVETLSILHLGRSERDDVVDLLNTHAFHFSSTERASIRHSIQEFCVNPDTPISQAWESYCVLRDIFDEMPRAERTEIMSSFFRRQRPDIGLHVFQHMRNHSRADTIPTADTYVTVFMGLAKLRDLDALEIVHNQLKLDYNVDVTTYVSNALIIGYTACRRPRKALEFWDNIVASREGPTYNSIHIALRACEKAAWGDLKAQRLCKMLREKGVELDQSLWASYIGALAGNGDNELAIGGLEQAIENGEVEPDALVIGSLFCGAQNQDKQEEVENWAKQEYPEVWQAVERIGIDTDENLMRTVRIDRSLTP